MTLRAISMKLQEVPAQSNKFSLGPECSPHQRQVHPSNILQLQARLEKVCKIGKITNTEFCCQFFFRGYSWESPPYNIHVSCSKINSAEAERTDLWELCGEVWVAWLSMSVQGRRKGGGGGVWGGKLPIFTSNSCDVPQSRDYSTDERDSVYDSTGQLKALLYDLRSTWLQPSTPTSEMCELLPLPLDVVRLD